MQGATLMLDNKGDKHHVLSTAVSVDSNVIVSGGSGTLKFWQAKTGLLMYTLKKQESIIQCLDFSKDGKMMASSVSHGKSAIRLWDLHEGAAATARVTLKGGKDDDFSITTAMRFSPDCLKLVSSEYCCGGCDVWDVKTGKRILRFTDHTYETHCATWSHDSKRIASSDEIRILVWDAQTGKQVCKPLVAGNTPVKCVAFRSDDRVLAALYQDVMLWEFDCNGEATLQRVLRGNRHIATTLVWSPDDRYILTGGCDGKDGEPEKSRCTADDAIMRMWEVGTGKLVRVLESHANQVHSVSWSPDGEYVVSGDGLGNIRAWTVQDKVVSMYACVCVCA